ncbi:hypothetical protein A2625_05945 [candidate division WOR-1 bacterium RIFCSPHIGHO2_01_FULL_53_15]|uniref:Uncharacterized protein n=1 Tax=candidate division WOR-1 bacterium RIFCSPHIGHO2_01_FULL_53_15 TaxID=1802564 RepID=A0A1F4Q118_UNCSA|nr:MAG: hypothetical protein A2625_05945 [candidate division WOR-1 bacterium RIFCSPHIGHO2_01_FULL_53_15]OGC13865.1 MAG: hypothetical protein A3D23_02275 [candidate division WOR-1 bacterium RIFCSPHIGHO2_02_FULL_53_26]
MPGTALFAAFFDAVKEINPRLANAYADYSFSSTHAWNTIFVVGPDQIDAYVIDATTDDGDGRFGNNLGGLANYNR